MPGQNETRIQEAVDIQVLQRIRLCSRTACMYIHISCLGPADYHHALSLKGEPPDEQGAANPGLWRFWIGGPSKKLPQQASHIACLGGRADYMYVLYYYYTLFSIHFLTLRTDLSRAPCVSVRGRMREPDDVLRIATSAVQHIKHIKGY